MKRSNNGVTVVEYAVLLVIIAVAVVILAPNVASGLMSVFAKTSVVMDIKY